MCEVCAVKCLFELTTYLLAYLCARTRKLQIRLPNKCVLDSVIPNPVRWCRMVFSIDDFEYLPFWMAAWNAVIFWEAMIKSNQWRLTRVTQNHWTYKFIRVMPCTGRWAEVTSILRLFHVHREAYTPFTFRGLVEFLILPEDRVDSLGNTPLERSDAAMQLINTALITPAAIQQLPIKRMIVGHIFTSF